MSRFQTILLSTAAVLAGVAGAEAADLPFRKAAPVEYVRVCDAFGAGFFYIPGTDTCLRVSGQIRAEYTVRGGASTDNPTSFATNQAGSVYRRDFSTLRARGYINADARTQTAYGTLRAFVSFRMTNDSTNSGPNGGRGETVGGRAVSTGAFQGAPSSGTFVTLDRGFIQFAGITAGRAQSFFDFDAQSYELQASSVANSDQPTEMFAYTATFGGGFSATVSVEDRNERTIADNGSLVFNGVAAGVAPTLPAGVTGTINNPSLTRASVLAYAGESVPDIVGNIRYDASWGSAQLSGAYHQVKSIPLNVFNGAAGPTTSTGRSVSPTADGFAALGGVKILLPMLGKGDSVTFQGSYEQGATDYQNSQVYFNGTGSVYDTGTGALSGIGLVNGFASNDAYVLPNGKIGMNHEAGGYAAFRHYFIPEVSGTIFGDYLNIATPLYAQRLGASNDSAEVYQVGGNVIWTPVKDLQIGGEVVYTNVSYKITNLGLTTALLGTTKQDPDDIRGRFTIRRAF